MEGADSVPGAPGGLEEGEPWEKDRGELAEGEAALTWAGAAPARGSLAGPTACLHGRSRRRRLPSRSRSRGAGNREPSARKERGRAEGAGPGLAT